MPGEPCQRLAELMTRGILCYLISGLGLTGSIEADIVFDFLALRRGRGCCDGLWRLL